VADFDRAKAAGLTQSAALIENPDLDARHDVTDEAGI